MITDDDLDRMLTDAGERWRSTHDRPAEVEFAPRRRGYPLLAAAAAVVVALAIALPIGLTRGGGHRSVSPAARGLTGTTWQLASADRNASQDRSITLRIADGQIAFNDGVNDGSGPVQVVGDQLRLGDVAISAVGSYVYDPISSAIDLTLQHTVRWSVTAGRLTITTGKHVLVYEQQPRPDVVLAETSWRLAAIFDNGTQTKVATPLTIRFASGGYTEHLECTTVRGTMTASGNSMTLSASRMTGGCSLAVSPDRVSQQNALAGLVPGSTTWTIDRVGRLVLSRGGTTLTFVAN